MSLNKSQRDVNKQFDQKQFNSKFEENEKKIEKDIKKSPDMKKADEATTTKLPHMRSFEDIVIIIREMFFKILDMVMDFENPTPYILSSPDLFYILSLILIQVIIPYLYILSSPDLLYIFSLILI